MEITVAAKNSTNGKMIRIASCVVLSPSVFLRKFLIMKLSPLLLSGPKFWLSSGSSMALAGCMIFTELVTSIDTAFESVPGMITASEYEGGGSDSPCVSSDILALSGTSLVDDSIINIFFTTRIVNCFKTSLIPLIKNYFQKRFNKFQWAYPNVCTQEEQTRKKDTRHTLKRY